MFCFSLTNLRRKKEVQILLRQHFSKMQTVYTPGNLEKFLIGLATQPSQNFDNYFTEEVFLIQLKSCRPTDNCIEASCIRLPIICLKKPARDSVWI